LIARGCIRREGRGRITGYVSLKAKPPPPAQPPAEPSARRTLLEGEEAVGIDDITDSMGVKLFLVVSGNLRELVTARDAKEATAEAILGNLDDPKLKLGYAVTVFEIYSIERGHLKAKTRLIPTDALLTEIGLGNEFEMPCPYCGEKVLASKLREHCKTNCARAVVGGG